MVHKLLEIEFEIKMECMYSISHCIFLWVEDKYNKKRKMETESVLFVIGKRLLQS